MKKLLLKLWKFVLRAAGRLDKAIDRLVPVASGIVEAVKVAIDTPAFDLTVEVLEKLIPGKTDDIILDKAVKLARRWIPKIALNLEIVEKIAGVDNPEQQLIEIFAKLENISGEKWEAFCTQLAQRILLDLASTDDTPAKITWGEAGVYIELYYLTYIKKDEK